MSAPNRKRRYLLAVAGTVTLALFLSPGAKADKTWKAVNPVGSGGGGGGGEVNCTYTAPAILEPIFVPVTTTLHYVVKGGNGGGGFSGGSGGRGGSSAILKNGAVLAQGAGGNGGTAAYGVAGTTVEGSSTFNAGDKIALYVGGGGGAGGRDDPGYSRSGGGGAGYVGGTGGSSDGGTGGSGGAGTGGISERGKGGYYGSRGGDYSGAYGSGIGGAAGFIQLSYTSSSCWLGQQNAGQQNPVTGGTGDMAASAAATCQIICNGSCPAAASGWILSQSTGKSGAAWSSSGVAGRCFATGSGENSVERMCCYFKQ